MKIKGITSHNNRAVGVLKMFFTDKLKAASKSLGRNEKIILISIPIKNIPKNND